MVHTLNYIAKKTSMLADWWVSANKVENKLAETDITHHNSGNNPVQYVITMGSLSSSLKI